eukprot:9299577-Alexandrium_andersonii.AAC.1
MSASLVGSEMCIRDSVATAHALTRGICSSLRVGAATYCGLPGRAYPDPVSYTHLTLPTICSV